MHVLFLWFLWFSSFHDTRPIKKFGFGRSEENWYDWNVKSSLQSDMRGSSEAYGNFLSVAGVVKIAREKLLASLSRPHYLDILIWKSSRDVLSSIMSGILRNDEDKFFCIPFGYFKGCFPLSGSNGHQQKVLIAFLHLELVKTTTHTLFFYST